MLRLHMYAVMITGGKQYRVQPGDILQVEKLEGDVGAKVQFDQVLFYSKPGDESSQIWVGKPQLSGAQVQGEIVGQGRGDKILIVKMKRRKQYRRTQGHRQDQTQVLITQIANGAGDNANLESTRKSEILLSFQSHLKAKGKGHSPRTKVSARRKAEAAAKFNKKSSA